MSETDRYETVSAPCQGLFKAKGSKHYGYVFPIHSEDDVAPLLTQLRKEHHAARHHCFAWRLGTEGQSYRSNDDGEPNNSAGPPILGALKSRGLTQCLAVVVRYFGGTKLGVGGLIEAYREATFAALDAGTVVERFVQVRFLLRFPYARMSEVMGLLKRNGLTPVNRDFQLVCQLEFSIRRNESECIARQLSTMDGVTFTLSSPLDNTTD